MTGAVDWDTSLPGSLAGSLDGDMSWLQQDQDLPWLEQLPAMATGLACDSGYEDDDSSLSLWTSSWRAPSSSTVTSTLTVESMTT